MPDISRPIQHFKDGVEIGTTPDTYTERQQRRDVAETRLRDGRSQLRTIREDARTFATGLGSLTAAQLTTVARQQANALFILARTLMDVELILEFQDDDGND